MFAGTEGMETVMIEFWVYGQAVPQGSNRVYKGRVVGVNPRLGYWREAVARAAAEKYSAPLFTEAMSLEVIFYRHRPASHYGTGRNAGKLKASAPRFPTTTPDLDKLVRAIDDALTGVLWRNDSQVVKIQSRKFYGEQSRAYIRVDTIQADKEEDDAGTIT